ncbi:glycosyltransferase family 1 protein [Aulographum hederae CBS 113979]|uniref:Glycosyltransferase family 1 protein n=1 Tax=Aulographum hederae CBS 113979 TaxID=1176131 RepID=A0A6G1HG70_9PEZI|nr:glycosyltransferase family 1 protein [Aulographum hederae CBS 113979]
MPPAEVLLDDEGESLVPTVVPPTTEFPYQRHGSEGEKQTEKDVTARSQSAQPDLKTRDNEDEHLEEPISKADPPSDNAFSRVRTAPDTTNRPFLPRKHVSERPKAQNVPSFIGGLRRSSTSRVLSRSATDQFDEHDVSSNSSETDSSDEEVQIPRKEKAEHGATAENARKGHKRNESNPFSRFNVGNHHFRTKGRVSRRDGRLKISVNEAANSGYLAKALGASVRHHLLPSSRRGERQDQPVVASDEQQRKEKHNIADDLFENAKRKLRLNIVVMVIGSRGDIQPFIKLGKILQNEYGHRVRIATHPAFRDFVEKDSGLEFFSVGGNPSELMAFMVKNPGLIPSLDTVKKGEIGRRRAQMFEMFQGMWRACINATDDETDKANMKMMGGRDPFIADAIIANPPSFAHVHIAERLGIPLHMMFTFPYSPTTAFPHPLANIKSSNVDNDYTNFMSYPLVDMMTWQGLGDLVNKFRVKTLGLEPVSTLWAPGQLYRLKVPYTYLWSPGLVPKPKDWGPEINIAGFVFLELASSFKPPQDLVDFLKAGPPPIYIGFGSIVVDDPDAFTKLIFSAVKAAGVRALVSKGWGGIGGGDVPENIFLLENTPHDWLFPQVSAVVHHGGAGTTAIGLKCARPTMIVPFFGDQPFWGEMVAKSKAGAFKCIPYKKLTEEKLAEGIKQCLTDEAKTNVQKIADSIEAEGDGAANAVRSFHRSLPLQGERNMRCSILDDRVAVWTLKGTSLRLCAVAAEILVERKKIKWGELRLIRHYDWDDFDGPGEPLTGIGTAAFRTVAGVVKGVGGAPYKMAKSVKKREEHQRKKKKIQERKRKVQEANKELMNGHANGNANEHAIGPEGHLSSPKSEGETSSQSTASSPLNTTHQLNDRPQAITRASTGFTDLSADPSENIVEELAHEAGHGIRDTTSAIAKAPMDLSLALAQGFHNAPRLYGDETVRRPVRITGFKSGLHAGGHEFVYGIYDGLTGLVMQPIRGAKKDGMIGCLKGIGFGIGGFVLKDIAAIVGPVAYTLKGVHKEWGRTRQPEGFVRRARILQGARDIRELQLGTVVSANSTFTGEEVSNKGTDAHFDLSEKARKDGAKRRKEVEEEVLHAWSIVSDALELENWRKEQGCFGRLRVRREKRVWRERDAFEDVGALEKALQARREGKGVKEGLDGWKRERSRNRRQNAGLEKENAREAQEGEGSQKGEEAMGADTEVERKQSQDAWRTISEAVEEARPRGHTDGRLDVSLGGVDEGNRTRSTTSAADFVGNRETREEGNANGHAR